VAKLLTFSKPNRLEKLAEEVKAALPALVGEYSPGYPFLRVQGLGDDIRIEVPDDADESAIAAVVSAHEPAAPTAGETLKAQVDSLASSAVGVRLDNLTAGQVRALMAELLIKEGAVATDMTVRPLGEWT